MHRLKHGCRFPDVAGWNHTQSTDQHGSLIGKDIAEEIGRDHDIEVFRVLDETHSHGIHEQIIDLQAGELSSNVISHSPEQAASFSQDVGFVDQGQFPTAAHGLLAGHLHDTLRSLAGDDSFGDGCLPIAFFLPHVQSLAVFPHDQQVDTLTRRLNGPGQNGPEVSVQIKLQSQTQDGAEIAFYLVWRCRDGPK